MYTPPLFREDDLAAAHALIRAHSFATLVTRLDGVLEATHVPVLLDPTHGPKGTLSAHVARANPIWKAFDGREEELLVFTGPHAYVSPRWYADKARNVPTWNYVAVHASGRPRLLAPGAPTVALLRRLVDENEAATPGPRWSVDDAPPGFVEAISEAIVAFEVEVESLVCKKKLSQNRTPADRAGALAGLAALDDPAARAVAALMTT
jgi:transcriptional regulator